MSSRGKHRSSAFVQFVLRLMLLGQIIAVVLIAMEVHLPLPRFALESSMEAVRKKGFALSAESMSFTLQGKIRAEGIVLRTLHENAPPLVKIDQFVAHGRLWNLLTGKNFINSIEIRRGTALFHEDPEKDSVISDITLNAVFSGEKLVGRTSGRLGDAQIWFDAETHFADLFRKRKGIQKTPFFMRTTFPDAYASLVKQLERVKNTLGNTSGAFISASLSRSEKGHLLELDGQAREVNSEQDISFEQVMANFTLRQRDHVWLLEGRPTFLVQKGLLRDRGSVKRAELRINNPNCKLQDLGRKLVAAIRLEEFQIEGSYDGKLDHLDAEIEIHELDRVKAELFAKSKRLHLTLKAKYIISEQSGSAIGRGELFTQDLHSDRFRELDGTNKLRTPSGISLLYAKASLGKACSITKAHLRATGRKVTYRGVETDRASVTVQYLKGGDWLLDPMVIQLGDSETKGSYARKPSRDYRFLLDGSMRPQKISPWFGGWWDRLWQEFRMAGPPLVGDFDVAGRWRDPLGNRRNIFGSVSCKSLSYRNLPVSMGHVKIIADSNRTIAHNLDLDLGRGWAKGTFDWQNDSRETGLKAIRFNLQGAVRPSDCLEVFGPNTRETLLKFESEDPIQIEAEGLVKNEDNASRLFLKASTNKPLSYAKVPLETLSLELIRKGRQTEVKSLNFQFAGGSATGSLQHSEVNGIPRLTINLELNGAERARAVEALRLSKVFSAPDTQGKESIQKNEGVEPTDKDQSVLDFSLSATGNPNDPLSFKGTGEIKLSDTDLGSINLFGPLTKTLQSSLIPLPTGSVNFTRLASTYSLDGSTATFDELAIVSSTALIRGKGALSLPNNIIDFNARMYLLGGFGSKIPILGKIAEIVDPLAKFIELELHGSVDNPQWTVKVASPALFEK